MTSQQVTGGAGGDPVLTEIARNGQTPHGNASLLRWPATCAAVTQFLARVPASARAQHRLPVASPAAPPTVRNIPTR